MLSMTPTTAANSVIKTTLGIPLPKAIHLWGDISVNRVLSGECGCNAEMLVGLWGIMYHVTRPSGYDRGS